MPVSLRIASILILLAAAPPLTPLASQEATVALRIRVLDESSQSPLAGAVVELSGNGASATTREDGRATILGIGRGERVLSVSRPGYATERVAIDFENRDVEADIGLLLVGVAIPGIAATGEQVRSLALARDGFYLREQRGLGTYIEADDIERMRPLRTVDIFRRIRGFRVGVTKDGDPIIVGSRSQCEPEILLDGILMSTMDSGDPVGFIPPTDINAIEAYAGPASIPPEFNVTGSACGVILIWSRRGS